MGIAFLKKVMFLFTLVCFCSACAPMVSMSSVELRSIDKAQIRHITLRKTVSFELSTHYSRTLQQGTEWREIGKLPQGQVFRPIHDVFTLEGRQVHEAYLVVSDNRLVGFYLPVERAFSPLVNPVVLNIGDAL